MMTMGRLMAKKTADRSMAAGEFKARCLRVMDEVARTRRPVVITKRGRPVARLVPANPTGPDAFFGRLRGRLRLVGDVTAPIESPEAWDPVAEFDELCRDNPPR
jgi:prevent-host-death family protein